MWRYFIFKNNKAKCNICGNIYQIEKITSDLRKYLICEYKLVNKSEKHIYSVCDNVLQEDSRQNIKKFND